MKQVLIETIPFSVAPIQLTEGLKAPSGNPLVEGILMLAVDILWLCSWPVLQ